LIYNSFPITTKNGGQWLFPIQWELKKDTKVGGVIIQHVRTIWFRPFIDNKSKKGWSFPEGWESAYQKVEVKDGGGVKRVLHTFDWYEAWEVEGKGRFATVTNREQALAFTTAMAKFFGRNDKADLDRCTDFYFDAKIPARAWNGAVFFVGTARFFEGLNGSDLLEKYNFNKLADSPAGAGLYYLPTPKNPKQVAALEAFKEKSQPVQHNLVVVWRSPGKDGKPGKTFADGGPQSVSHYLQEVADLSELKDLVKWAKGFTDK
jgi:hypothetical protein